ncbi:MAG: hypothetical protein JSR77_08500 [Planctomycetes bacterium]|nr:hypothetical protein [Planctomycetota bacterium]
MRNQLFRSIVWTLFAFFLLPSITPGALAQLNLAAIAGDWCADYSGKGEKGWASIAIAADGSFSGTVVSRSSASHGTWSGHINADGTLTGTSQFGSDMVTVSGLIKAKGTTLSATVSWVSEGKTISVKSTFKRWNPNASVAAFAGEWGGTWSFGGIKGTMRLLIGTDGSVAGRLGGSDGQDFTDEVQDLGQLLPNGIVLGDDSDSSLFPLADLKVSGSSMTLTAAQADDNGKVFTIKVSLKRQTGVGALAGSWSGTATSRGETVTLDMTIDANGGIEGRETDSPGSGGGGSDLSMLILPSGVFAGIAITDGDMSVQFVFGTLKLKGNTLSGSGTLLDSDGHKTSLKITFNRV